ncbi:unnamed protein product [Tenebrio molitor]|nr:unnamed protein product [Tenebrio molitor]
MKLPGSGRATANVTRVGTLWFACLIFMNTNHNHTSYQKKGQITPKMS